MLDWNEWQHGARWPVEPLAGVGAGCANGFWMKSVTSEFAVSVEAKGRIQAGLDWWASDGRPYWGPPEHQRPAP